MFSALSGFLGIIVGCMLAIFPNIILTIIFFLLFFMMFFFHLIDK